MALNYKTGTDSQSAITANTNGTAIDLLGYNQLSMHLIFGTCTGTAETNTAAITVETSNDNSNWDTLHTLQAAEDGDTLSGTTVYDFIPDNATANQIGFGRYVRFVCTIANTVSITYEIKWLAKG